MDDRKREVKFKDQKFTIEKGIELFVYGASPAPWRELVESMKINDSVLLSRRDAINFQQSARSHGYKVSLRKIEVDKIRVWRIE